MHQDLAEVLLDADTIAQRVDHLAGELATILDAVSTREEPIVMLPVLTGSLVFTADLIRHLPHKLRLDVVTVSSYPGTSTSSTGAPPRGRPGSRPASARAHSCSNPGPEKFGPRDCFCS